MGLAQRAGLALACMATLAMAEDLLFYDSMTYQEYTRATSVLGYTGRNVFNPVYGYGLLIGSGE